ncbi:MAG: hypothetical protein QME79_07015 [Bacillota bacterium]|nr:hypothetical protein [Bacillota bacterium]
MRTKWLLGVVLAALLVALGRETTLAVPRPSWNFAWIESLLPADPLSVVAELDQQFTVGPTIAGGEFIDPRESRATLEAPLLVWLTHVAALRDGYLDEEDVTRYWEQDKEAMADRLTFLVWLKAPVREYADLRSESSRSRAFLVDDAGRRFEQAPESLPDLGESPESEVVLNRLEFPLTDAEGKRIITSLTKHIDLCVVSDLGEARFRFKFPAEELASEQDLRRWMTYYYGEPRPELLVPAVKLLAATGALDKPTAVAPLATFLGQVFRQNPEKLSAWVEELGGLRSDHQKVLWRALWSAGIPEATALLQAIADEAAGENRGYLANLLQQTPPDLLTMAIDSPAALDMLWAAFLATGDGKYVARIIEVLPWAAQTADQPKFYLGAAARWSLTSNALQHQRVLESCVEQAAHQPEEGKAALEEIIRNVREERSRRLKERPQVEYKEEQAF